MGDRVKRDSKPSFKTLVEEEESTKSQLRQLLHKGATFSESNIDVPQVRDTIIKIKEAVKSYLKASKALSNYYLANASVGEGNEIRSERLNLAYEDAPETIKALNQLLRMVNEDAESSLVVNSVTSLGKSASQKSKLVDDNQSVVESQVDDLVSHSNQHSNNRTPSIQNSCIESEERFYASRISWVRPHPIGSSIQAPLEVGFEKGTSQ